MLSFIFGLLVGSLLNTSIISKLKSICHSTPRKNMELNYDTKATLTKNQIVICHDAAHQCDDVGWLNLVIQRYYLLAIQSFAFKDRVRRLLNHKVKEYCQYKIIKDIEVTGIDLGTEFCVIKNITALTEDQYKDIINSNIEHNDVFNPEGVVNCNDLFESMVRNCLLLIDLRFDGNIKIDVAAKLKGDVSFKLSCSVKRFNGKMLCRFPAKLHLNRFEATFITNPNYQIAVEPLLASSNILQSYSSKLVTKAIIYGIIYSVPCLEFNIYSNVVSII